MGRRQGNFTRASAALAGVGVLGVLVSLAACSNAPTHAQPEACTPGATSSCACPNGGSGTQTCASDGMSFGTCQCTQPLRCAWLSSLDQMCTNNQLDHECDAPVGTPPPAGCVSVEVLQEALDLHYRGTRTAWCCAASSATLASPGGGNTNNPGSSNPTPASSGNQAPGADGPYACACAYGGTTAPENKGCSSQGALTCPDDPNICCPRDARFHINGGCYADAHAACEANGGVCPAQCW